MLKACQRVRDWGFGTGDSVGGEDGVVSGRWISNEIWIISNFQAQLKLMSDFAQRYSTYSTKELLTIVGNPGKYQPAAMVAAKQILASRNLSGEEIVSVKQELKDERDAEIKRELEKKESAERLKNSVTKFASATSPIGATRTPVSKTIVVISIVFGFIALAQIASEWSMIEFMFNDVHAKWDGEMLLYFVPMLFLPVAVTLFAFRKKAGWLMLTIYLSASIAGSVMLMAWELLRTPSQFDFMFMPPASPYRFILGALFYTITLFVICKASIKEIFHVSRKSMITSIVVGTLVVALPVLFLFS